MKFIDILFVLSAAATANAILIPADSDGSPQASETSSQVSDPTNEPSPNTSDQSQQQPMNVVDPRVLSKYWKVPVNLVDPSVLDEYSRILMNEIRLSTPEDWKQLLDTLNSGTSNQDQQLIDVAGSSTSNKDQQQPTNELDLNISEQYWQYLIDKPDPNIPKEWKSLIDQINSNAAEKDQQPMDETNPNTSNKSWKRPINKEKSENTGSNQDIQPGTKLWMLDKLKSGIEEAEIIQRKKRQAYNSYVINRFKQKVALSRGEVIYGSRYSSEAERKYKKEYIIATKHVEYTKLKLKRFMKKHGLEFGNPN
ncbi:hypothetical protein QVD99_007834 [Batrachochytrium dendrobatidis]|nr:hypothetical protein QVD99_007834 [Batrachochytrium dendrobatidis]